MLTPEGGLGRVKVVTIPCKCLSSERIYTKEVPSDSRGKPWLVARLPHQGSLQG